MKPWLGLAFVLASCGSSAVNAQSYSNFRVQPNPAQAGQAVSLVVHAAWCDYLPAPQASVRVTAALAVVTAADSDACFGVGSTTEKDLTVALGTFAPGTYRLSFVGEVSQRQLTEIPFTVTGIQAAPVSAPVGGGLVAGILGSLLAVLAAWRLRRRAG